MNTWSKHRYTHTRFVEVIFIQWGSRWFHTKLVRQPMHGQCVFRQVCVCLPSIQKHSFRTNIRNGIPEQWCIRLRSSHFKRFACIPYATLRFGKTHKLKHCTKSVSQFRLFNIAGAFILVGIHVQEMEPNSLFHIKKLLELIYNSDMGSEFMSKVNKEDAPSSCYLNCDVTHLHYNWFVQNKMAVQIFEAFIDFNSQNIQFRNVFFFFFLFLFLFY